MLLATPRTWRASPASSFPSLPLPIKPILDVVVISATVHAYVSQSDRGEIVIGAGADVYNSYAQRGGLPQQRAAIGAVLELFPTFSRLKLMRQWAGRVDVTPDTCPLM